MNKTAPAAPLDLTSCVAWQQGNGGEWTKWRTFRLRVAFRLLTTQVRCIELAPSVASDTLSLNLSHRSLVSPIFPQKLMLIPLQAYSQILQAALPFRSDKIYHSGHPTVV